jgi:hypothetical protein
MKSSVAKRSIVIGGHKTSISLEDPFWADLKNIAHSQQVSCRNWSLRSTVPAIRLFVFHHVRYGGDKPAESSSFRSGC